MLAPKKRFPLLLAPTFRFCFSPDMRILTKVNTCSHPKVNGIRSVATLFFD